MGHVREGEFTREVCLEAVLRAWPGWGVCHYHCLQHPRTAELASEDIRLQVQNCHLPSRGVDVCSYLWPLVSTNLEQSTCCRKFNLKLVLMSYTHSILLYYFFFLGNGVWRLTFMCPLACKTTFLNKFIRWGICRVQLKPFSFLDIILYVSSAGDLCRASIIQRPQLG